MLTRLQDYVQWLWVEGNGLATLSSYKYKVMAFCKWLDGRPVCNETLREYGRVLKERGLRPRTRHVTRSALKSWLGWMHRTGQIADLPDIDVLDVGKLDVAQRRCASDADIERLWVAARALPAGNISQEFRRHRALMVLGLACYTGMRRAELLTLNLADLRDVAYVRNGKGSESRWVPLHSELSLILAEWLEVRSRWAEWSNHNSDALLPANQRSRMSPHGIASVFRTLCAAAGVTAKITPHVCRHWFATKTHAAKGSRVTQKLLGHSSILTTERYLRADASDLRDAVDALPVLGQAAVAPDPGGSSLATALAAAQLANIALTQAMAAHARRGTGGCQPPR